VHLVTAPDFVSPAKNGVNIFPITSTPLTSTGEVGLVLGAAFPLLPATITWFSYLLYKR
jgi:hypothetical protein